MFIPPSSLSHQRSPELGDEGVEVEIFTLAPPPPPPPPAMLMSIVEPLTAKVFPAPMKFSVVALPILLPADEIPIFVM